MSDLDEKLREILDYCAETYYPLHEYPDQPIYTDQNKVTLDEAVAQIKQAFVDAGYLWSVRANDKTIVMNGKDPLGWVVYYPNEVMTGQEWYERFVDSLDNEFHFMTKPVHIDSSVYYDAPNVMKAARRAAGIEDADKPM